MKILRTTGTFYPHVTGPAYQAYRISKGLVERGHSSPLVTTDTIPADEEPGFPPDMDPGEEFPFDVTRRSELFSIDQYRFAPTCAIDYFSESFDIVHCHGYHNSLKDIFYICSFVKDQPFIIHGHGSFSKQNDPTLERTFHFRLYDLIWKRTIEKADAIVVSSRQERRDAIEFGVDEGKIHVIPVGKDKEVYESVPLDPPKDEFRILFVGRLAPRRNVELLIKAIAKIDEDDVELRIVGGEGTLSNASRGGYIEELRSLADDLGVGSQITFTGPKYGDELIKEYRSAHVFANPSHYENFGQATLEAAFSGLPLIVTPTGVGPMLVDSGEVGYLAEDEQEFADYILELRNSPSLQQTMSEEARRIANSKYNWNSIIEDYLELYDSII